MQSNTKKVVINLKLHENDVEVTARQNMQRERNIFLILANFSDYTVRTFYPSSFIKHIMSGYVIDCEEIKLQIT